MPFRTDRVLPVLALVAAVAWASGRPTFDAFYAGNYSYVIGPFTAGPHFAGYDATGRKAREDSMTPAELFGLYTVLSNIKGPRDSLGLARARAWVRANRVETKFPADLI